MLPPLPSSVRTPISAPLQQALFETACLHARGAGNGAETWTALDLQGVTGQDDEREFLVNLGLTSNRGVNSRPTPYHDKVTLYAGMVAEQGTGDVWAFNPLVTQSAGSGEYTGATRTYLWDSTVCYVTAALAWL